MTAYEEYKARLKVPEESNESKSSGDCAPFYEDGKTKRPEYPSISKTQLIQS